MKKLVMLLIINLLFLFGYGIFQDASYQDYQFNNIAEYNTFTVPLADSPENKQLVIETVYDLCQKYQINMVYIDKVRIEGEPNIKVTKYVYYPNEPEDGKEMALANGRYLDTTDVGTDHFISSEKTDDPNQVGEFDIILPGNIYGVYPMSKYEESGQPINNIFIDFKNEEQAQQFILEFGEIVGIPEEMSHAMINAGGMVVHPPSSILPLLLEVFFIIGYLIIIVFSVGSRKKLTKGVLICSGSVIGVAILFCLLVLKISTLSLIWAIILPMVIVTGLCLIMTSSIKRRYEMRSLVKSV